MSRLIVISNRVAIPHEKRAGGMAVALQAALCERGGVWFGWSGKQAQHTAAEVHHEQHDNVTYATIDLSRRDYNNYYKGFANRSLWPLFHYRPDLTDYQRSDYEGYIRVNKLFAEHLTSLIQPDDILWIHDYHLIPLASLLREHGIGNHIGFFLHTPLAPAELLITLPHHRQLFGALSACDLVGLQTTQDLHSLREYFEHEAGATLEKNNVIALPDGRRFHAASFPISIDTATAADVAREAVGSEASQRLRQSLNERALMIGVDRLDYSKGLPERFDAFAHFLQQTETWRKRVCLLQVAPPSRSDVPEYRQIRRELERRTGHINGSLASPDWVPIRYVNQTIPYSVLAGYYRMARVGLVTPLRDGMNLVAKEYVACQDPDDPGVLVLSRFAGAAEELDAALLVNPHDEDSMAEALLRALDMPLDERRRRWRAMMDVLETNDIAHWQHNFLSQLDACGN
ncbi:MAG TPA: alpha,alpha-trehalose-phosphate synthase (UDP-forming) [Rhodanobacteraceae bacterium]|nr:alpha,alpha-trehalose-phosphate synthase (UDP-forming) [Rhodanobacteraceae bacterium]